MTSPVWPSRLGAAKRALVARLPRPPRAFHAYGVGAGKTGTHSVDGLFSTHYRSAHEPERGELVFLHDALLKGRVSERQKRRRLLRRDRWLNLEMDSSALNRRFAADYVHLFPESRFILTVRDPFTRTDSLINQMLNTPPTSAFARERRDLIFGGGGRFEFGPEDRALLDADLYPLDALLAEYMATNAEMMQVIPDERLLVLRTDRLAEAVPRISEFLGIPPETIDTERSHVAPAPKKHGILAAMDPAFVDARVKAHCSEFLSRFFPEIGGVQDVRGSIQPKSTTGGVNQG